MPVGGVNPLTAYGPPAQQSPSSQFTPQPFMSPGMSFQPRTQFGQQASSPFGFSQRGGIYGQMPGGPNRARGVPAFQSTRPGGSFGAMPQFQNPFSPQQQQQFQNPYQPQQQPQRPAFLDNPEFQGYKKQNDELNRQMNDYMRQAPMYQQLQDLQSKMQGFQKQYEPQGMDPAFQGMTQDQRMRAALDDSGMGHGQDYYAQQEAQRAAMQPRSQADLNQAFQKMGMPSNMFGGLSGLFNRQQAQPQMSTDYNPARYGYGYTPQSIYE
jgi:hypothetical protein